MHCVHPECTATSMSERIIVPSDETQVMFRESLRTHQSVVLCETHYHMHHPCAGCGAKPKARQNAYARHSPDPATISQYLCERTEFGMTFTPTDTFCKSCYDMHLIILQHIEKQTSVPQHCLQSDIQLWNMTLHDSATTQLTRAVLASVVFVAKLLQQDSSSPFPSCLYLSEQLSSS